MRFVGLAFAIGLVFAVSRPVTAHGDSHLRFVSAHGAIHVWTPEGYDQTTAATVLFVHGYFANVDDAWRAYHLADQFRASQLNAMFIACEAPVGPESDVRWSSVDDLIASVASRVRLPEGRVVAIGHSAAHRTFDTWLDSELVDTFVFVDAAYGDLAPYRTWLAARPHRRLIDVSVLTDAAASAFHATLDETLTLDALPKSTSELPADITAAHVIHVHSRIGHMALITGGTAIPIILRMLDAPVAAPDDPTSKGT